MRPVANLNINATKEKPLPKGLKRDFRGIPLIVSEQGGLETVEPSSSHVGKFYMLRILCKSAPALRYLQSCAFEIFKTVSNSQNYEGIYFTSYMVVNVSSGLQVSLELLFVFYLGSDSMQAPQHNPAHQPQHQSHEVGDLVGFLQGSSGQGTFLFCHRRSKVYV